jgi:predicted MFS family arabinose efflux permease
MLASAMAASTFMLTVFGVLAGDLIDEFGVERWQIGALVTSSAAVAALVSPRVGGAVDRAGARRSTVATIAVAALALAAVALAPTYPLLVVAAMTTAGAQAMANPATNKLIAEQVPDGARGVVTGVKQSGVQVGVFAGGLLLPVLAAALGWRSAVLVFVLAAATAAVVAGVRLPQDDPSHHHTAPPADDAPPAGARRPLPVLVRRVTVYGLLLGAGGSAIFTYLPLYAEEALGVSAGTAGRAVALTGLVGIAARIGWGRAAELRLGSVRALRLLAGIAVLAPVLLILAGTGATGLLWPAAVVTGLSASAWNAVGMLAIIQGLPPRDTGRASGVVMFGFLTGLGLGAPAFGLSVDRTGSYVLGWSMAGVLFAAALALAVAMTADTGERLPEVAAA